MAPGLEPEMIEVQVGEEEDFDDTPLCLRLQMSLSEDAEVQVVPMTSHSGSRCNIRWHKKKILGKWMQYVTQAFLIPQMKKLHLSNTSNKYVETK
jgi:hypothetical protein